MNLLKTMCFREIDKCVCILSAWYLFPIYMDHIFTHFFFLQQVEIEGKVLPHSLPGQRYQFITETSYVDGNTEDVTMCNVEQIVLDYYQSHGFPNGKKQQLSHCPSYRSVHVQDLFVLSSDCGSYTLCLCVPCLFWLVSR